MAVHGLPVPAHVNAAAPVTAWPSSSKPQQLHHTLYGGSRQLAWLLQLVLTYASATLLLLHVSSEPDAVWRQQVPRALHYFSCAVFGTAFLLDALAAAFHADTSRLEVTLLPAWVKGVPFVSSLLMATGHAVIMRTPAGKLVNVQRYICWMHTTPAVLYLIKSASPSITQQHMLRIILLHEVQLGLGAVAKLCGGMTEVVLGLLVHLALVPVILFLHKGLKELGSQYSRGVATAVYATTLATYASFGLVWDLDLLRLLSPAQEEAGFLVAEFLSKMLFSTALMFSNLRTRDLQRMAVMRAIEAASKQRLIEELSRRAAQKDSFMSAVSHELRTPLNSIIGLSEAALQDADALPRSPTAAAAVAPPPQLAPVTRQQLTLIRGAGLRLLSLVNDILDATALQHDRLQLGKQRVVLAPLVKEVADLTRPLLRKGVVLLTRVPEDVEVIGDADRIVQVLNNLVSNAIKFCESGSILITARYVRPPGCSSSSGGGGSVAVAVQDTGLGIPQHKLNTIFQPFEQVHAALSRSQRGLGLGLSIVHKLVTAMGGNISVASAEQQGSTFTFTLPAYSPAALARDGSPVPRIKSLDAARQQHAAAACIAASSGAAAAAAAAPAGDTAQQQQQQHEGAAGAADAGSTSAALAATRFYSDVHGKRQLLVVDDDPINHQVLSLLLVPAGYELLHVTSGPETLQALQGCALLPDVLLLDVSMPGMNGLEVCGVIRGMQAGSGCHLPIIMVTAQASPGAVHASMAAGADHHLTKPYTREQLLQAIEATCAEQRRPSDA